MGAPGPSIAVLTDAGSGTLGRSYRRFLSLSAGSGRDLTAGMAVGWLSFVFLFGVAVFSTAAPLEADGGGPKAAKGGVAGQYAALNEGAEVWQGIPHSDTGLLLVCLSPPPFTIAVEVTGEREVALLICAAVLLPCLFWCLSAPFMHTLGQFPAQKTNKVTNVTKE